ncbi:EGF-like domain protein [Dictyocaulus viviparus]|uniref:EGF-like domain protein n=1 Tax=Dictyocaulus viviparus TaxID=29172 RepID=A0A0D8Y7W8_DICVI|nr:EGF-like domain protein [Dictyocaulus viviparus]
MLMNMSTTCIVLLFVIATAMADENSEEVNITDITVSTSQPKSKKSSAGASDSVEENTIDDVKKELDRAVQGLNSTVTEAKDKFTNVITEVTSNLDTCKAKDCNDRGTCLGTKKAYVCACVLGYSGKNCEETMCDSSRDCNGRGICFGTTSSLTCLCNIGYRGRRCEKTISDT